MIIVGMVLIITFVGGAYAAPSIQQVFVTNFPSNLHVTVTNPSATSGAAQNVGQKTVDVVDNLNVTLPPCPTCDLARDGTFIAASTNNSSLGFRQATIYVHWASISP